MDEYTELRQLARFALRLPLENVPLELQPTVYKLQKWELGQCIEGEHLANRELEARRREWNRMHEELGR